MNTKSVMLLLCLLLAAAAVQTGCTKRIYEIEMTADGETLTRQITVSEGKPTPSKEFFEEHNALHDPVEHVYYPLPDEEKLMLQKLYPQQMTDTPDENILRFRGSFTGSTPQDVGGAGLLMHYETQMGSTGIYIERFRGENMAGHVTRGQQAADRLADLFIGWFESEMKADPRFPQLREWMDTQFRDDLKNLSVLTWAMSLRAQTSDEPQLGEIVPRIVQYLMERGYFTADDLPAMVRNIYAGEWGELGSITLILPPKMLARRMGIDAAEKLPDSLAFLSEPHRAAESFRRYVENTDAYKAELAEWEKARQADPAAPKPAPETILDECWSRIIMLDVAIFCPWEKNDVLKVSLKTPAEPFMTNGKYDESSEKVVWKSAMEKRNNEAYGLPVVLYAVWSRPNEEFQLQRLGRVVFEDMDLMLYCLWEKSLTEQEAVEWKDFVASLDGQEENVAAALQQFRFSGETDENHRLSDTVKKWINPQPVPEEENNSDSPAR